MAIHSQDMKLGDLSLVRNGPAYRLACLVGLGEAHGKRRALKILLLILVTWVPLLCLSLLRGEAWGRELVRVPLLEYPVIYSRFLFVLPLLELARRLVEKSMARQTRQFLRAGLVREQDQEAFANAQATVLGWRNSNLGEAVILVLACVLPLVMQVGVGLGSREASWSRTTQMTITPAGWWYILVSLPILFFFLLRWLWVYLLWASFLAQISSLKLELTPTHPDQAGGLGFLASGLVGYAPIVMAVSAVISGGFAYEILHHDTSLNSLKYHVVVLVAVCLLVLHAPLLVFANQLRKCRVSGLYEFARLVGGHDRAFDERWVRDPGTDPGKLLGNPDATSVAMLAQVYDHIQEMQVILFDKKSLKMLVAAALFPLVPLLWTALPISEILGKLAHLMM